MTGHDYTGELAGINRRLDRQETTLSDHLIKSEGATTTLVGVTGELQRLVRRIEGNGKPGIIDTLNAFDKRATILENEIKSMKSARKAQTSMRITIALTFLGPIVTVLVTLLVS